MKRIIVPIIIACILMSCGGKTTKISYDEGSQFEIISKNGPSVILDLINTDKLEKAPTSEDALAITHGHNDHYTKSIADAFPGKKLIYKAGTIESTDYKITSIVSSHDGMPLLEGQSPTNYLYLIEMDGLRFLHMGDIGQDSLTEEQLKIIGDIDILMTQTENGFSKMTFENKKGFKLIEQINPHIILLTHSGEKSYKYAKENWTFLAAKDRNIISLSAERIRKLNKAVIIMGSTNLAYKKMLEAKTF